MALQTSGAISLNDLATEFGGNTPHAINEYYRGGGLVPDTATNSGIPTSGQVDLNDFYGGDVVSVVAPPAGTLAAWGSNANSLGKLTHGALGRNQSATFQQSTPVQTVAGGTNWTTINDSSQPAWHAIKTDGRMWGCGFNGDGNLGDNTATSRSSPVQVVGSATTWQQGYRKMSESSSIKTDGRLWLWGEGGFGQLGDNTITDKSSPVQTVSGGTNWATLNKQLYQTAAIKTDGRLWGWGNNNSGALGDNTTTNRSSPVQTVSGGTNWDTDTERACFSSGGNLEGYGSGGIKTDGRLWMWGRNYNGQLGDNTTTDKSSPVQVVGNATTWDNLYVNAGCVFGHKTDGRLWHWGAGDYGASGVNNYYWNSGNGMAFYTTFSSPVQNSAGGTNWGNILSIGFRSVKAIKTDGRLWSWGQNSHWQGGTTAVDGDRRQLWSPRQTVVGGTNWVNVASGGPITSVGIRT